MLIAICWILLVGLTVWIAYQDIKTREINLLSIVGYGILSCYKYSMEINLSQFFANLLFAGAYLLLILLVTTVFYRFRIGKWTNIIDSQIGLGDLLLFICVGGCLEPLVLLNFFTACFIFSLVSYFLFFKKKSVPLAGLTAIFYLMFYVVQLYLIDYN